MATTNWQLFLSGRHRRLTRLWQSFFAGWGLFFMIGLLISPFVFQNITWSILGGINLDSVQENNLSMQNLEIRGVNSNGEPFFISSTRAAQRFDEPEVIYFTRPRAIIQRQAPNDSGIIRDDITAHLGRYYSDKIILTGDVLVKSSDGSVIRANEMQIDLE